MISSNNLSLVTLRLSKLTTLFVASLLTFGNHSYADSQQELVFFTSAEVTDVFSADNDLINGTDFLASADMLYSYSSDRFRFLGEYLWSSDENELERLALGWRAGTKTMLWLGRFHQAGRFWGTEYHHGQFLQTSISRPWIEEWEDEGGPIPSHVTGVLLETEHSRANESVFRFAFSAGLAPKLVGGELQPYDLFDPSSGHGLAVNFRATYRPDFAGDNQAGLLGGWSDINVEGTVGPAVQGSEDIDQRTLGVFVDWHWIKWRLLSSVIYVNNKLGTQGSQDTEDFLSAYIQADYYWRPDWIFFGRTEISDLADDSVFLDLMPNFVPHRNLLGVRWDFQKKHSLTLEIAETGMHDIGSQHDHFKNVTLQWSAAIP